MGISAVTTAYSFAQASKQRKLQLEAQNEAQRAMDEAKKKLEMNFYETLAVKKEPYELQREAAISAGAQATQAATESERGAAAAAGRIQMAQQEEQAGIRTAMGKEMTDIDKLVAAEESRLRDVGVQIGMEEAAGAQQAAADAKEAETKATTQAFQGLTNFATQAIQAAPLYMKSAAAAQEAKLQEQYNAAAANPSQLRNEFKDASGKPLSFQQALSKMKGPSGWDYAGIGNMKPEEYQNWVLTQKARTFKNLGEGSPFSY